jgi:hypothetical protein
MTDDTDHDNRSPMKASVFFGGPLDGQVMKTEGKPVHTVLTMPPMPPIGPGDSPLADPQMVAGRVFYERVAALGGRAKVILYAQHGTDEYDALELPATARMMASLLNACLAK